MNELQAFRKLQNGSEKALEWFIDRYAPYVHTIVYNILGQSMRAEDIEEIDSDVFLQLWNCAGKIRPLSIKGWLGCVARNMAKNKLRQANRELLLEDDFISISGGSTPEHTVLEQEQRETVRQAVLEMDLPDREIFLRHYYYCQPVKTIAEEMNMNLSTVKTHLRRGRAKLSSALEHTL